MSRSAVRTIRQLSTDRFSVILGIIAFLGAGLILVREINYGVGLGDDSVEYISLAKNLLEGEGFTRYYGGTLIRFPPLYPIILSGASFFFLDPLDIAGPLNAIIFGLSIFVVGRWLQQHLSSPLLALWGCLILIFSIPIVEITSRAMSEPAYILFMLLALIQADNHIRKGTISSLIGSAILTAVACMTRFVGVSIVAIVVLVLFLKPNMTAKDKGKRITAYSLISLMPVIIWMVRTYIVSGKLAGNRYFESYSLPLVLEFFYEEVILHGDPIWLFLPVVPVVAIGAIYRILSSSRFDRKYLGVSWHTVLLFFGFALAHILVIFISFFNEILAYDILRFDIPRFMLPTYIPLLVGSLLIVDQVLNRWRVRGLHLSIAVVFLLSLAYQMARNVDSIQASNDLGFGHNNKRWTESEALQYIRDTKLTGTIISNYAGPIYVHTDTLDAHRFLPCEKSMVKPTISDAYSDAGTYILWFYDSNQACDEQGSYGLNDLFELPELETVALPADGVLFKVIEASPNAEPYRLHRLRYESIISGDLLARSVFDVYLTDDAIHYVKEPCGPQDTELAFFLHLVPVDVNDLPAHRQTFGFDNLDFHIDDLTVKGLKFDEKCLATIPRPDYDVARIRTGQWNSAENRHHWQAEAALQ